jgi:CheY-like chemotaxis protein
MNFQSLLVCSDDRTLRVLRNVLGELEIEVEHCADTAAATRKLAQQHYEAVIIDCNDQRDFSLLQGVRSGQHNRKSMAVAIIDADTNLHSAFDVGANFVVYKPISIGKAKSSFRAARALMKQERRRSARLNVNIPAYFRFHDGEGEQATITGLSEGGLSARFGAPLRKKPGVISVCFALPDTTIVVEATGMMAWQDPRRRAGIQFASLSDASRLGLKDWLRSQNGEKRDPPIRCTLTALSLGGCFLRTESPFPAQTQVEALLRAADCSVRTQGKVRFMDPELGMGIQFMSRTGEHRSRLEELIQRITLSPETVAEVLVEPEGLDWENAAETAERPADEATAAAGQDDPLVELFGTAATLSREEFLRRLEQHELAAAPESEPAPNASGAHRREPRIAVSHAVQIWSQEAVPQMTSMIDVSHHGARIDQTPLGLKAGDLVQLVSDGQDARFRVIWVGEVGTPQAGQVGLQRLTQND